VLRALGGGRDDQLGAGDRLPAGGMVLADPGFVIAECVEMGDQVHVAGNGEGRVVAGAMEGREEDSEDQAAVRQSLNHWCVSLRPAVPRVRGDGSFVSILGGESNGRIAS